MRWLRLWRGGVLNWGLTMNDDKLSETELDALFEAAQRRHPVPSADWLARVAQDADRALRPVPAPLSFWAQLSGALGGWRGLGGMALASAVGVWIGIAPPVALGDPVAVVLGTDETVETFSEAPFELAALLEEG